MTTEEAINFLSDKKAEFQKWIDIIPDPKSTYPEMCKFSGALDMAIDAIRSQQEAEKNEPLTLDELREMEGEPVWLASLGEDFDDGWYIVVAVNRDRFHCLQLYAMLFFEHYGKTWLAYRHKPEEETTGGL